MARSKRNKQRKQRRQPNQHARQAEQENPQFEISEQLTPQAQRKALHITQDRADKPK
ncbi:MAG: hypothetical protein GX316_02000 [Firmicutes bacterium]|nr:hypothetical protein [Bacillota bacterium]